MVLLKNLSGLWAFKHSKHLGRLPRPATTKADSRKATQLQQPLPWDDYGVADSRKPAKKSADSKKPAKKDADS